MSSLEAGCVAPLGLIPVAVFLRILEPVELDILEYGHHLILLLVRIDPHDGFQVLVSTILSIEAVERNICHQVAAEQL